MNAEARNSSTVIFEVAAVKWREYGIVPEILSIQHAGLPELHACCVSALVRYVSTG